MSQVKNHMATVLGEIQQNRLQLAQQIEQQKAQIAQMEQQLPKYDSLIAALQVGISDPQVLAQVEVQADMNSQVPLADPAGDAAPGNTGNAGAAAEAAA